MCEFLLCQQLSKSLDAAFGGGVYDGEKIIRAWGRAVVDELHKWQSKCRHPHSLVWDIAHHNLQNITMNCPCEGLAQAILRSPDAFLRTTLILASQPPSGRKQSVPVVFH
jgi:hypothetical protein